MRISSASFFKNPLKDYLFVLLLAVLGLHCYVQTFCSCSKWDLSLVAVHRLLVAVVSHCGAQALRCVGSVVVVHGLSCPGVCGIFPDQDQTHGPLHWQVNS